MVMHESNCTLLRYDYVIDVEPPIKYFGERRFSVEVLEFKSCFVWHFVTLIVVWRLIQDDVSFLIREANPALCMARK